MVLLLEHGADPATFHGRVTAAFHVACEAAQLEIIGIFLARGVPSTLKTRSRVGVTCVQLAPEKQRGDVMSTLLASVSTPAADSIRASVKLQPAGEAPGAAKAAESRVSQRKDRKKRSAKKRKKEGP